MALNWPPGYQEKIEAILGTSISSGEVRVDIEYDDENKEMSKLVIKKIQLMKKQLGNVKKEVNMDMSGISAKYSVERQKVSGSHQVTGLFFGRKMAGSFRQDKRESLSQQRKMELAPYENVKHAIDNITAELDRIKLQIEMSLMR